MPAFAANLTMNYPDRPFLDRFAAAAADGFRGVEFLFPYEHPPEMIRSRLDAHGLVAALFNAPAGDWEAGERGLASLPGREDEFRRGVDLALAYCEALKGRRLHVMAGLISPGEDRGRRRATYVENLAWAARQAVGQGVTILIEPINTRDIPGYFLTLQEDALDVCEEVGAPNLKLQLDLYHAQIMQGDLTHRLRRAITQVGHVQVASVPDRCEPDEGEVDFGHVFAELDTLAYEGWVGCEYRPRGDTSQGLAWLAPWRGRVARRP